MTILFLANRFPYPPFRGDKLKIFNLAKRLSKKHNLVLLTFVQEKNEYDYIKDIEPYFSAIYTVYLPKWKSVLNCIPGLFSRRPLQLHYFRSNKMKSALNRILSEHAIDLIHTQHLRMSQYTADLKEPRILDLPDAYSLYFKRRKTTSRKWYLRLIDQIEIRRLVREEQVIRKFDLCLVCSKEDKAYLEKLHQAKNIDLLINGVDLEAFNVKEGHDYAIDKEILFTGNMDYAPNVDAVHYFCSEIFPVLKEKFTGLKFRIAGQRPVSSVKQLASEDIIVTGFIPDLSDVYRTASVLVAPLRFGAGTQNKVLEAMAMGLPVVCTHIGFEGLDIESGQGVLLGKGKEQFIQYVEELLESESLRREIGEKGLYVARNKYSWDIIAERLNAYFHSVKESSN